MSKRDIVELVSVTVKINGKVKTFKTENIRFRGWEWSDADSGDCDSGVDLEIHDGKKHYKLDMGGY